MSLVISDTTPLNYLILIGQIEVLPRLFGRMVVPPAVVRELLHPKAPAVVSAWASALPVWVEVRTPKLLSHLGLDPGETEAITLALETPETALLMDDWKGRRAAEQRGILVVGTLAVLDYADEVGLLNFEVAYKSLAATNFHVEEEVIQAVRRRVRTRRA